MQSASCGEKGLGFNFLVSVLQQAKPKPTVDDDDDDEDSIAEAEVEAREALRDLSPELMEYLDGIVAAQRAQVRLHDG